MPVFSLKSTGSNIVNHKFQLLSSKKISYLKLLHFHHNIDSKDIKSSTYAKNHPRLLMANLNLLGLANYDNVGDDNSDIVLGPSKFGGSDIVSKDLYKVLIEDPSILNSDIELSYKYVDHDGVVKPFESQDLSTTSSGGKEISYALMVFEYGLQK